MSHRDAGNECPFEKDGGAFDLTRWNDAYWQRFDRFLQMTHERGIIVQLELWETWDHYGDHEPQGDWSRHPFNPRNNINYTAQEAGLLIGVADDGAIAGIENDRLESDDKFMRHLAQGAQRTRGSRRNLHRPPDADRGGQDRVRGQLPAEPGARGWKRHRRATST